MKKIKIILPVFMLTIAYLFSDSFFRGKSKKIFERKGGALEQSMTQLTESRIVITPVLSIGTGTYTNSTNVAISSSTAGVSIYYTTDNTEPNSGSKTYTEPITVSSDIIIKAIAMKSGWESSKVVSASYAVVFLVVSAPTFTPAAGSYASAQSVALTSATSGASIYYSTNGASPDSSSSLYSSPLNINVSCTVKAIAVKSQWGDSTISSASYTINNAATPDFTPSAGTYNNTTNVTITCATSGAVIYYTTNGTVPTVSSDLYGSAIPVSSSNVVFKAIAVKSGLNNSEIASGTFILQAAAPVITPASGNYTNNTNITLATVTAGAVIRYTTNGTDPTESSVLYSAPFSIVTNLKAISIKAGMYPSTISTAQYTTNLYDPGLVFWSKLGSDSEITSPVIGPSFSLIGTSSYEAGKYGNAFIGGSGKGFTGNPTSILSNNSKCAISIWWKPSAGFNATENYPICNVKTAPSGEAGFIMGVTPGAFFYFTYFVAGSAATSPRIDVSTNNFTPGNWHHVAMAYDRNGINGEATTFWAFIDGVRVTAPIFSQSTTAVLNNISFTNVTNQFTIGNHSTTSLQSSLYVRGSIDNIKVYNYAKTNWTDRLSE